MPDYGGATAAEMAAWRALTRQEQMVAARQMRAEGLTLAIIANRFNKCPATISQWTRPWFKRFWSNYGDYFIGGAITALIFVVVYCLFFKSSQDTGSTSLSLDLDLSTGKTSTTTTTTTYNILNGMGFLGGRGG